MWNNYKYLCLLLILFGISRCNTTEPPPDEKAITLKLEDVSCTEAWITLNSNIKLPATIELKQNSQVVKTINLNKSDSLLYIDSLLPNTSYQYQVSSNKHQVSSNSLNITTMDTTSHNFTWQTWTFGEHSSSVFIDVAIINENNIWAVGEIYMNDSLGQPDPNAYNVAHWDGSEWKLYQSYVLRRLHESYIYGSYPASSIMVFQKMIFGLHGWRPGYKMSGITNKSETQLYANFIFYK